MSTIVKVDASGAVTLPAALCQQAGLLPGGELVAEVENGRIVVKPTRMPIWQRILALTDAHREEVEAPADGAAQVDHYLYGTPKTGE